MLRILIPGHRRSSFRRRDGTYVRGSYVDSHTKLVPDTGEPGRTPENKKVIPELKKGSFGISFSSSTNERRNQEIKLAKQKGEKSILGKLAALQVLNKNTNPDISRKASSDRSFIASHFINKKYLPNGGGYF